MKTSIVLIVLGFTSCLAWSSSSDCGSYAIADLAQLSDVAVIGLIFHSDRGSEFLGAPFRRCLLDAGIEQSMTRGGAPEENAHIESFFHSLKADGIHGRQFRSVSELRGHLRSYMRYYNYRRLHSALDYRSPVDYERRAA